MIKQTDTGDTNEENSDALSSSEIKNEQKKLFMSAISKQTKVAIISWEFFFWTDKHPNWIDIEYVILS